MFLSQEQKDQMREDIRKWGGGKERLLTNLNSALDALIYLAENPNRMEEYEGIMKKDWLDAFLIIHYHSLVQSMALSPLILSDSIRGRRREVKGISSKGSTKGDRRETDLFLVDPYDIREIARKAMLITMHYMEERNKVQRLLAEEE